MFVEYMLEVAVNLGTAFGMGFYIATSPCIFPLLPLFLIRNLQSEENRRGSLAITGALWLGLMMSLGVFAAISGFIGLWVVRNYITIQGLLGIIVAFLGIVTMSHTLREKLRLTRLRMTEPGDPKGLVGVFAVGFSYAMLAAPCTLPVLFALPLLFSLQSELYVIILMVITLGIGVAAPYLAIALATGEARSRVASRIADSAHKIEIVVGLLLVVVGLWLAWPLIEFWLTSG
ncbi:MAG: cytochrome c biogenesis CcdA family protein [Candidatus Thorarchaeota archaeon]|jgi:cytochrome c biogenesis protein CcdA